MNTCPMGTGVGGLARAHGADVGVLSLRLDASGHQRRHPPPLRCDHSIMYEKDSLALFVKDFVALLWEGLFRMRREIMYEKNFFALFYPLEALGAFPTALANNPRGRYSTPPPTSPIVGVMSKLPISPCRNIQPCHGWVVFKVYSHWCSRTTTGCILARMLSPSSSSSLA